ncbi:MAG: HAD hydrolase family protein [Coriobacteriales bacterium]|nr:HAD hydrolase family protein [Coriobacteriales bacterium]
MNTIVFLDLDNTFWTDQGVPDSALEAVHAAQAKGNLVFTNTGRARAGTRPLMQYGLDGRCYAAGAEVFFGTDKISDVRLGADGSHLLRDALDVGEGILIAEGGERCFVRAYDEEMLAELKEVLAQTNDPFIDHEDISQMSEQDHAQIHKYSLFMRGGVPESIKASVPGGYIPTTMGEATEFTTPGVTKASALETVRSYVEERSGKRWRTMALGDAGNDIPMIRAADVGVSMGNGTDAAKEAADFVTRDITDDGLAFAFECFGLI